MVHDLALSASRAASASTSRAATAASKRAAFAVAAFGAHPAAHGARRLAHDRRALDPPATTRPTPRRARSASSVAPLASHSSIARASSASASSRRPAARNAAASARRASAWSSSASVAAAMSTAARAKLDGGGVLAAPRQRLGAHAAPGDRRLQVVAGERLALVAERFGLGGPALRQQRAAEQRRGLRRIDAEPVARASPSYAARRQRSAAAASPSSSSMSPAKTSASRSRCVMPSSSTMRRDDAIIRRAASVRPRSASSTAWQRSATASTAGAPCVMRSTRTTSRQRPLARVTGLGPHSAASGAPASTALARRRSCAAAGRGERAVERGLAGADLAEPRERERVHRVRLRFAGGVARRRQLVGRRRDRVGGGAQRLRIGEHGELAGEAGVPRAQALRARR